MEELVRSPACEHASACPGGHLMLACSTNSSALRWNVTVFSPLQLKPGEDGIRLITRTSQDRSHRPITFNQTPSVLNFSQISTSPLASVVSVNNVTADLNQTRIECSHEGRTSVTIIHVIGSDGIVIISLYYIVISISL